MPVVRKTRKPNARDQIQAAALGLLNERGYDGMSLQAVADQVGVRKSAIFYHFRDKADLVRQVMQGAFETSAARLAALDDGPPRLEQLLDRFDEVVERQRAAPGLGRLAMRLLVDYMGPPINVDPEDADHPLLRSLESLRGWLRRAIAEGVIRPVDPDQTILSLMALAYFYPAVAHDAGRGVLGADPWSGEMTRARKSELRELLRRGLEPRPS